MRDFEIQLSSTQQVNEPFQHLMTCAAFGGVAPEVLKELASSSQLHTFLPREPIYLASDRADSLCLLVDGRIAVGNIDDLGKRSWLIFIRPGELFGEQSVFDWPTRDQYGEPFERSRVLIIPANLVRNLIVSCADLAASMLRVVGERLIQTNLRWTRQFYLSNRERLIHVLLDIADQYGSRDGDTTELTIDLSHEDLSGFTGSTRESVSVEIGRLRKAGLLTSSRLRLVLRQMDCWVRLVERRSTVQ